MDIVHTALLAAVADIKDWPTWLTITRDRLVREKGSSSTNTDRQKTSATVKARVCIRHSNHADRSEDRAGNGVHCHRVHLPERIHMSCQVDSRSKSPRDRDQLSPVPNRSPHLRSTGTRTPTHLTKIRQGPQFVGGHLTPRPLLRCGGLGSIESLKPGMRINA